MNYQKGNMQPFQRQHCHNEAGRGLGLRKNNNRTRERQDYNDHDRADLPLHHPPTSKLCVAHSEQQK
jgi:hypothetical protein